MPDVFPDWYLLIKAWLTKGRYGLTLPFLVGARAHMQARESATRQDIVSLLDEIVHQPVAGQIVHARWCGDYQSVVLAIYSHDSPCRLFHNVVEFSDGKSAAPSLVIEKGLATNLKVPATFDSLLQALIKNAEGPVTSGNPSRYWTEEGVTFGPLQAEDLEFIRSTVSTTASPDGMK